MERRPFVAADGTVKLPAKPSASHYHLKMKCLTAACANFNPNSMVTPPDVHNNLTPQHFTVLSKFGLYQTSDLAYTVLLQQKNWKNLYTFDLVF